MKISLNWVKEYTDINLDNDELLKRIGSQLGEVEEVVNIGERYDGVVVAKVEKCEKHPNADKLSLCFVDDNEVTKDIERDKDGLIQVVCGAPNITAGQLIAWIPPGVAVPESITEDKPFVLDARELRGEVSNGMIASAKELGISSEHDGILVIEESAKPGQPFMELYGLDDLVIDIENKVFTHRPDCFGILGLARELAGIQKIEFNSPDWYLDATTVNKAVNRDLPLSVKNTIPDLVPRFTAVAMSNVNVGPSSIKVQSYLNRVGIKPINNIVDLTNYLMHLTAQPLHAYDYDKLVKLSKSSKPVIQARLSTGNEKLVVLGGKVVKPNKGTIVIATDDKLIGVAGVIGGVDTEVDENTKNIVIECASFDMYSIRRTSMAHGLFTDAVTRFNKGQSPSQNDKIITRAVELIGEVSGAKVATKVFDLKSTLPKNKKISITADFINARLGLDLKNSEVASILENVEFSIESSKSDLQITAPFWRTDISIPEDIVEEVGRLTGYDMLPRELPLRDLRPPGTDKMLELKMQIRGHLSSFGANEALTYSFVHSDLLKVAGQSPNNSYKINNAISPDLHYYRQSITPSLLDKIYQNIRAGYDEFALFEINKVHHKEHEDPDDKGLPKEWESLGFVYTADNKVTKGRSGAAFYKARKILDELGKKLGVVFEVGLIDHQPKHPVAKAWMQPFETDRSAFVRIAGSKSLCGFIGEYRASTRKQLKLPYYSAGFELDLEVIHDSITNSSSYQELPRFPKVEQDISLRVDDKVSYIELKKILDESLNKNVIEGTHYKFEPLDIYQPSDQKGKQLSFRLSIASYSRTLKSREVNDLLDRIAETAHIHLKAVRL